jgi:fatty acid amide hydrolase
VKTAARSEPFAMTATEMAGAIRTGELSSREAVESCIRRIEEVNAVLNALVMPRFEEALVEADAADRARSEGAGMGPLHGVPITIKDQFDLAGFPTTLGVPNRAAQVAAQDGPLVGRLRHAGGIVLGKTNVPQLCYYHECNNPVFGQTNNPWNLARSPGGSSGGEASLIAAGGSPLGLGADIGGSIRVPSHFCGIAGIKPTSRRLAMVDTPMEPFFLQDVVVHQPGPMARSVPDLSLAMSVLAAPGQELFDILVEPRGWPDPAGVEVSGLRCGLYEGDGWFSASPGIRRAVGEAGSALEAAGGLLRAFEPPDVGEAVRLFLGVMGFDGLETFRDALRGQTVVPQLKGLMLLGSIPKAVRPLIAAFFTALGRKSDGLALRAAGPWPDEKLTVLAEEVVRYRERFIAAMDAAGVDVVLCPPYGLPALVHGAGDELTVHTSGSYAALLNLLGFPAGTVPVTRVRPGEETDRPRRRDVVTRKSLLVEQGSAGLPVGVQVFARPWREDVVLRTMGTVEAVVSSSAEYPRTPASVSTL